MSVSKDWAFPEEDRKALAKQLLSELKPEPLLRCPGSDLSLGGWESQRRLIWGFPKIGDPYIVP